MRFAFAFVFALAVACGGPSQQLRRSLVRERSGCELEDPGDGGPPGIAIVHMPAATERYVGSPSLVILEDGTYLASHDVFGPQRPEPRQTHVYRSTNRGASWARAAILAGQYWSTLFEHHGAAYVLGVDTGLGEVVIRRSDDAGITWGDGVALLTDARYHTAPVPVVEHEGRIWRAMEEMLEPVAWPESLAALLISASVQDDLLDPASWTRTPALPFDQADPGTGWMEGNVVIGPAGAVLIVLRVEVQGEREHAAFLRYEPGQNVLVRQGLRPFPGGSKKFTIRFDAVSGRYWSLVNDVLGEPQVPGRIRNRLSLASSTDLEEWTVHATLLEHPDREGHGFQYADHRFDGEDLVFVSRTAFDDGEGGADDFHNANYLTFHRLRGFRACAERALASP